MDGVGEAAGSLHGWVCYLVRAVVCRSVCVCVCSILQRRIDFAGVREKDMVENNNERGLRYRLNRLAARLVLYSIFNVTYPLCITVVIMSPVITTKVINEFSQLL